MTNTVVFEKMQDSSLPTIYFNKHFIVSELNLPATILLQKEQEKILGKSFYKIIQLYDENWLPISGVKKEFLIDCLNKPSLYKFNYVLETSEIQLLLHLKPVYSENIFDGVFAMVLMNDVFERKKMVGLLILNTKNCLKTCWRVYSY